MTRAFIAAIALTWLCACSKNELDNAVNALDTGSSQDSADRLDDSGEADTDDASPAWFGVEATFTLAEGALSAGQLELTVFVDDGEVQASCVVERPVAEALALESTPDPSVFHWWRVALGDGPEDEVGCEGVDGLPPAMLLGLGALHVELERAVRTDGYGDQVDSFYGAYVNLDDVDADQQDRTAYLLGYAGTEASFSGAELAQDAGPLPDGEYRLVGHYLLALLP